jgi:hypothetical protein
VANTTTSVAATIVVVVVGKWSQDKPLDIKIAVGGAILAIGLAGLSAANEKLAGQLAALILVTALLLYTVPIARKLGLTERNL